MGLFCARAAVRKGSNKKEGTKCATAIRSRPNISVHLISCRAANSPGGVDDVRAGRPARFDDYAWDQGGMPATDRQWAYEKGRQFATIAPRSMPLRINGKLNLDALRLLVEAINRGDITP